MGICLIGWLSSYATPDALDRHVLLAINLDAPRPLLDAGMVAITDYSIPFVALLLCALGLGAEAQARGWITAPRLLAPFAALGVALAATAFAIFGATFSQPLVPIAMTPLIAAAFALAGARFRRFDAAALSRLRRIFWLTLLAVLLAELAIDLVLELGPARARPFARANADWNGALRVIPDEHVRSRSSYPSGHAGAICALLAPAFWIARGRALRLASLALAVLCVYPRVYLAAHFPSDALAGAAIGAAIGTLVAWVLDPELGSGSPRHPGHAPST